MKKSPTQNKLQKIATTHKSFAQKAPKRKKNLRKKAPKNIKNAQIAASGPTSLTTDMPKSEQTTVLRHRLAHQFEQNSQYHKTFVNGFNIRLHCS